MESQYMIIIPAYKPDHQLIDLVISLKKYFQYIIVVNDGNDDSYKELFQKLDIDLHCTIINHYVNLGKGRALKSGFNEALKISQIVFPQIKGVITVDADGQHLIKDIIAVKNAMDTYPKHLILGCRTFHDSKIPLRSRLGNKLTSFVFQWLCGVKLSDTQTGLRGIPIDYVSTCCKIDGEKYEYETNMILQAHRDNLDLKEIPISTIYENGNKSSHFNPLLDSLKIYQTIFKYSLASLLSVIIEFYCFNHFIISGKNVFISTYLSRALSAIVNFGINRTIVFRTRGNIFPQLIKYFALLVSSATMSALLIFVLKKFIPCDAILLKAIVDTALYFINYYFQNTVIFSKKKD